ncbi:tetratricopeptide repeat protein, partial [bacterium]|nr:tetratricopeptide repeat protein [bacterium]
METMRNWYQRLVLKLDPNRKRLLKRTIFFFPVIFVFCFVFLKVEFIEIYRDVTREDGFIEYTQSLIYFLSFIFALSIAISFFKKKCNLYSLLYLVLSLGLFFVSMEEIGWGQRIFNITIPGYFIEHNVQSELSFHNLSKARPYVNELYILVGFFGAFSWLMLPKKIKANYNSMVNYFVPNRFLTFYFFPVFAIYIYIAHISGILVHWFRINSFHIGHLDESYFIDWRDQEPAELLLSFGFLLFVLINKYRQNKNKIFEKRKSVRLALTLLFGSLFILAPVHIAHVSLSERIYPYNHFELGNVLYLQGKIDKAIDQYSEALQIDPIHAESHNNLGNALVRQGRL